MCMLGKRKFVIYKRKYVGAAFTDSLKAFDTATHDFSLLNWRLVVVHRNHWISC